MNQPLPQFDYHDPAILAARLKVMLPPEHALAFEIVNNYAQTQNQAVYLVGGIVRDLLLGRPNLDLDFVCLSDARPFARALLSQFQSLSQITSATLTTHPDFLTASLELVFSPQSSVLSPGYISPPDGVQSSVLTTHHSSLVLDFTTARREIYVQPAALPTVDPVPVSLEVDLRRRDFTINALALSLDYKLIDHFNGLNDLQAGLLRVLHPKSFEDDPTRMVRGVRFAARFDYRFEPQTEVLLEKALQGGFFALLSPERRRNELWLILREALPEKGLAMLYHYKLLQAIHSSLNWSENLQNSFLQLREHLSPSTLLTPLAYLAALLHLTEPNQVERIVNDLRFPNEQARVPVAVARLWHEAQPKLVLGLKNSQLYALLHPYDTPPKVLAIFEALLHQSEPERAAQVGHYRQYLAHLRPQTGGDFLIKRLGLKPGPRFKIWLAELLNAVLDGEIQGHEAEEAFLRRRATD